MTTWFDYVSFVVTFAVFAGVIYGVTAIGRKISDSIQDTKRKLKEKGLDISGKGVKVKTEKAYTREDYIDDTQRKFINFGKKAASAASVTKASMNDTPTPSRQSSTSSVHGSELGGSGRKLRSGRNI